MRFNAWTVRDVETGERLSNGFARESDAARRMSEIDFNGQVMEVYQTSQGFPPLPPAWFVRAKPYHHAEPSPDSFRIFCDGKPVLFLTSQAFYTSDPSEQLAIVASLVTGIQAAR